MFGFAELADAAPNVSASRLASTGGDFDHWIL
jgi:hypothetical protein